MRLPATFKRTRGTVKFRMSAAFVFAFGLAMLLAQVGGRRHPRSPATRWRTPGAIS